MSTTILRHEILARDVGNEICWDMPRGARVLSVLGLYRIKQEFLAVYTEANTDIPKVKRKFKVVSTGHVLNLPVNARFVGSAAFLDGSVVLHVFDLGEV